MNRNATPQIFSIMNNFTPPLISGWQRIPVLAFMLLTSLLLVPGIGFGQCNPEGGGPFVDPSQTGEGRYEFEITPGSSFNLLSGQFCTASQQTGTNCCPPPGSNRCVDIIFNITDPDGVGVGEDFSSQCGGQMTLMTAQGNFEEAFLSINGSDPNGSNVDCNTGVNLGNNYQIIAIFEGQGNGDVLVTLEVLDNNGNLVPGGGLSNIVTPSNMPSYAVLTICKPGSGCIEDEFVFDCCTATASVELEAGAPGAICDGGSSTLKFTADQGVPPYTVSYVVDDGFNPSTLETIEVGTLGGPSMAMATLLVSPTTTTTYTILSVEDNSGCTKPPGVNNSVTITVFDIVGLLSARAWCSNEDGPADPFEYYIEISGAAPGSVNFDISWDATSVNYTGGIIYIGPFNHSMIGGAVQILSVEDNDNPICEGLLEVLEVLCGFPQADPFCDCSFNDPSGSFPAGAILAQSEPGTDRKSVV